MDQNPSAKNRTAAAQSFFLQDIGHPLPVFGPPADLKQGGASGRRLKATIGVLAGGGVFALALAAGTVRPLEATVQMERLAVKIEQANTIQPATAREIARLVDRPWFDCGRVACTAQLAARNRAARARLEHLLAAKLPADPSVAISKDAGRDAGKESTGAVTLTDSIQLTPVVVHH